MKLIDKINKFYRLLLVILAFLLLGSSVSCKRSKTQLPKGMEFVFIPGGTFIMGSPNDEKEGFRMKNPKEQLGYDLFI